MRLILAFVAISLYFSPSISFAGFTVGNGGSGVLCEGENNSSLELLEDYEGRVLWNLKPSTPSIQSIEPVASAKAVVSGLARLQPFRAAMYMNDINHFFENTNFLDHAELALLPDSLFLALPEGCKTVQIAIQRKPEFPNEKLFNISSRFWSKLDSRGKALLILHEIIYKDALSRGATDSRSTRYFNELISSDGFEKITAEQLDKIVTPLGFIEQDVPAPLAKLSETLSNLLIGRTVYRNVDNLVETNGTQRVNSEYRINYDNLIVSGRVLQFSAKEYSRIAVYNVDKNGDEIEPPRIKTTLFERTFKVTFMQSTGALLGEVRADVGSDLNSSRRVSAGQFIIMENGDLQWSGTTVQYADRLNEKGGFDPVQGELVTTWSLQDGKLIQVSIVKEWNYDPSASKRTTLRSQTYLRSNEVTEPSYLNSQLH